MADFPRPETASFAPSFSELVIDRTTIERDLGYRKGPAPEIVRQLIEEILPEIPRRVAIRCGYRILPTEDFALSKDSFRSGDVVISTGPIIGSQLRRSRTVALFVATAGPDLEHWSHQLMAEADMMKGYIVDAIGSEVANRATEWVEQHVTENAAPRGWKRTNRYSPGYCDWSVTDQQKLFSLLPPDFCGISLTPSSLMVPIKSLSSIIGLGPDVKRGAFQCTICELKDCFQRVDEAGIVAGER